MNKLLKYFIENSINFIEEGMYDDLYDYAYEFLPDDYVKQLNTILSDVLDEDFTEYAKQNIIKHLNMEINNFVTGKHSDLSLASFVRMYMNHINGLDWDEFQLLVEQELKESNLVKVYDDGAGDLYIARR